MRLPRIRLLVAAMAALSLLAAACGDDDDDDADAGSDTTEEGGDEGGGATFEFVPLDVGGPNTKAALENGDIDIAVLFSSDGAIAANDWVALEDDQSLQPVDNFIPAVRSESADAVAPVLNAVQEALTVEGMQEMVAQVAVEGENPEDVAAQFLEESVELPDESVEGSFTVGGSNFPESEITAELYAQALEAAGADVSKQLQIGAREVYFEELVNGGIDIVPEFVGSLSFYLDENAEITSDLDASVEVARGLAEEQRRHAAGARPTPTASTRSSSPRTTADEFGLETVSDLAGVSESLTLGGPPECPERPACILGLQETYGLEFNV